MIHEKIIKRDDGSRVKIRMTFHMRYYFECTPIWRFTVEKCEPRKRTFNSVLPDIVTRKQAEKICYKHVTKKEVQETMLELWQKLKPSFSEKDYIHFDT